MEIFLTYLEEIAPTFLAIMSLGMFTPKTRWLSYGIVVMAIFTEFMPQHTNITALLACISCLLGLLVADMLHTHDSQPSISRK